MGKKVIVAMASVAVFLITLTGAVSAKEQATCPVMGCEIDKKVFADHNGKRVYFCCNGCVGTFKKAPKKYIKQLEAEGVELTKTVPR